MDYFAEDHTRIGSISIIVEPQTQTPSSTNISPPTLTIISPTKVKLTSFKADFPDLAIDLPCETSLSPQRADLQSFVSVKPNSVIISLKLPTVNSSSNREKSSMNTLMHYDYKWSSKHLKSLESYSLHCRDCNSLILQSDSTQKLQVYEMPSESWAELMDFWHCHKPHDHSHSNQILTDKFKLQTPANSIISAHYYITVNLEDGNLQKTLHKSDSQIHCSQCQSVLGKYDTSNHLDMLLKWKCTLRANGDQKQHSFEPYMFVYYTLLDMLNSSGLRLMQFQSMSPDSDQEATLLIWVFNTGVNYTLSDKPRLLSGPTTCKDSLKVYYTTTDALISQERQARGDQIETMDVSWVVYSDTLERLHNVNARLPRCVRGMGNVPGGDGWLMSFIGE